MTLRSYEYDERLKTDTKYEIIGNIHGIMDLLTDLEWFFGDENFQKYMKESIRYDKLEEYEKILKSIKYTRKELISLVGRWIKE